MRSFNGVLPSSHPPNHGWTASRPPSQPQLPSWTNFHLSLKCLLNWVTKSRSQPSILMGTGRHRLRPACPTQFANTSSTNTPPRTFGIFPYPLPPLPSRLAVVRDPRGGSRHVTRAAKGQCCTPYLLSKPKPTSRNQTINSHIPVVLVSVLRFSLRRIAPISFAPAQKLGEYPEAEECPVHYKVNP